MKGIILAAGEGSRLRPLTADRPKCLVEYRGKPLLDYSLSAMRACGIDQIIVVKGYRAETIERPRVRFKMNSDYATTNMVHSLFCAEDELDDDIVVSYGDIIYREDVLRSLLAVKDDFAVAVDKRWEELWRQRTDDPLSDAETLKLDLAGFIQELGKKPKSIEEIEGQYIGLFKMSADACAKVKDFYHALDRRRVYDGKPFEKMFMTSFLQEIIDHLMPVKAAIINGGWLEVDSPGDLHCHWV
jgi:choline kinase